MFVSTVFDEVANGPAIYARYLWDALRDDPDLDFHVVAPSFAGQHERLHPSGVRRSSRDLYRTVCEVARLVAREGGTDTIIHGNGAHFVGGLLDYPGPVIAQINDYEEMGYEVIVLTE